MIKQSPKDGLYDLRFCDNCSKQYPSNLICFKNCGVAICDECLKELQDQINTYVNLKE